MYIVKIVKAPGSDDCRLCTEDDPVQKLLKFLNNATNQIREINRLGRIPERHRRAWNWRNVRKPHDQHVQLAGRTVEDSEMLFSVQ